MARKTAVVDGKCVLDATKTTYLCTGDDGVVLKMEPATMQQYVKNLRALSANMDPETRASLDKTIESVRKNPSLADVSIPMDAIEMIGKFKGEQGGSVIAVKLSDAFASQEGLGKNFIPFQFSEQDANRIDAGIPLTVKRANDIKEFVDAVRGTAEEPPVKASASKKRKTRA